MRGRLNESELRERIAYIHGRIEREIEGFAASLALPPLALTTRVGALLLGIDARDADRLPDVSVDAGPGGRVLAALEGAGQSHGSEPREGRRLAAGNSTGKAHAHQVISAKRKAVAKSQWSGMTAEERSREMKRRMKKWRKGKKKTPAAQLKKQALYNARNRAKRNGLPLPPLPGEQQAA